MKVACKKNLKDKKFFRLGVIGLFFISSIAMAEVNTLNTLLPNPNPIIYNPVPANTIRGTVYKKEKIGNTYRFKGWACAFNSSEILNINVWLGSGHLRRSKLIFSGKASVANINNKAQCGTIDRKHGFDFTIDKSNLPSGITPTDFERNNFRNVHLFAFRDNDSQRVLLPVSALKDQFFREGISFAKRGIKYYPDNDNWWWLNHADIGAAFSAPVASSPFGTPGFKLDDGDKSLSYSELGEFLIGMNGDHFFNHTYTSTLTSPDETGAITQWPAFSLGQRNLFRRIGAIPISELEHLYLEMEVQLFSYNSHYDTALNKTLKDNSPANRFTTFLNSGITIQIPGYNPNSALNPSGAPKKNFIFFQAPLFSTFNSMPSGVNRYDIYTGAAIRAIPYSVHGVETLWSGKIVRIKTDILPYVRESITAIYGGKKGVVNGVSDVALDDLRNVFVGAAGLGYEMTDLSETKIKINYFDLTQVIKQQ